MFALVLFFPVFCQCYMGLEGMGLYTLAGIVAFVALWAISLFCLGLCGRGAYFGSTITRKAIADERSIYPVNTGCRFVPLREQLQRAPNNRQMVTMMREQMADARRQSPQQVVYTAPPPMEGMAPVGGYGAVVYPHPNPYVQGVYAPPVQGYVMQGQQINIAGYQPPSPAAQPYPPQQPYQHGNVVPPAPYMPEVSPQPAPRSG